MATAKKKEISCKIKCPVCESEIEVHPQEAHEKAKKAYEEYLAKKKIVD